MTGFPFPGLDRPPPNGATPPNSVGALLGWVKDYSAWLNGFLAWLESARIQINTMRQGKLNCTGDVTLAVSATSTTLNDARITAQSFIDLMPKTANAAAAKSVTWVSARDNGSATISHAADLSTDRSYTYVIIG